MSQDTTRENDVTLLSVPQVILLALLLTMVSSVATAIIVVQLMAGTPGDTVFQTIEKVTQTIVERPTHTNGTTTVIIKEGDLVARAIASVVGSSESLYTQTNDGEIIGLGNGFKIDDTLIISAPMTDVEGRVNAGLRPVSYFGSNKIMLWQVEDDGLFSGPFIKFTVGNPQVGQTMVFVAGSGLIIKGIIQEISQDSLVFSESLRGKEIGLLMDVGGTVIGVWNGSEIVRSSVIHNDIASLSHNKLHEYIDSPFSDPDFEPATNPDDINDTQKKAACELLEGSWNSYGECLGVDQGQCLSLGGQFNECASACRHDANTVVCTMQCVVVCQL